MREADLFDYARRLVLAAKARTWVEAYAQGDGDRVASHWRDAASGAGGWTPEKALEAYREGEFWPGDPSKRSARINAALRSGEPVPDPEQLLALDAAMTPLGQKTKLFRGIGYSVERLLGVQRLEELVGKTIVEPAFTSTSRNRLGARNFGGGRNTRILVLDTPADVRGFDMKGLGRMSGGDSRKAEKEVLLERGLSFEITRIKRNTATPGGGRTDEIHAKVIPPERDGEAEVGAYPAER